MPEITYREALRQALRYQLENDERVFLMGEDIGAYGGSYAVTKGFLDEFGDKRVKDTPISESVVVGAGIGAAMAGLKPMVELMGACKANGVWPFAHFNRLQVTPPCTITADEAREGLAGIDKALEVADRYVTG